MVRSQPGGFQAGSWAGAEVAAAAEVVQHGELVDEVNLQGPLLRPLSLAGHEVAGQVEDALVAIPR